MLDLACMAVPGRGAWKPFPDGKERQAQVPVGIFSAPTPGFCCEIHDAQPGLPIHCPGGNGGQSPDGSSGVHHYTYHIRYTNMYITLY